MCLCVCVRKGVWVCMGLRACMRRACARVCVRVRIYEYVGVIPYMGATFKVSRLAE